MSRIKSFSNFLHDESGAVTVDWVVLTAAIVGLGLAVVTSVRTGVVGLGGEIETQLEAASVVNLGTLGYAGGTSGSVEPAPEPGT